MKVKNLTNVISIQVDSLGKHNDLIFIGFNRNGK